MVPTQTCACCGSGIESEPADTSTAMTCYCPIDGVMDTVGKKYSMQLVALLGAEGPIRYGAIKKELGVTSDSTLAERLEQLADHGLIDRHSFDEIPPRVEYSLTEKGEELQSHLQPLLNWAAQEADVD